jgi:hypothetical protein
MNSTPLKLLSELQQDSKATDRNPWETAALAVPKSESMTLTQRPKWQTPTPIGHDRFARSILIGQLPPKQLYTLPPLRPDITASFETKTEIETEMKDNRMPAYKPAKWIREAENNTKLAHIPGTAAYYKSLKFRLKVAAGKDQVPGRVNGEHEVGSNRNRNMATTRPMKKQLILIISRTTVRRADRVNRFGRV